MASNSDMPGAGWQTEMRAWAAKYKVRARWERAYPFVLGGIVASIGLICSLSPTSYKSVVKDVLPVAISVAAVLAGFQGAGQAIMLSLVTSKTEAMEFMKQTGNYKLLTRYIWDALALLLVFIAIAMVLLTVHSVAPDVHVAQRLAVSAMAFFMMASFAASYRIMKLLVRLLELA